MLIKDREGIKVKIRCRSKIKIQMKYLLSSPPPGSIQRPPGLITEYCLCCLSAVMKPGIKRHTFRPSLLESVHGVALGSVRENWPKPIVWSVNHCIKLIAGGSGRDCQIVGFGKLQKLSDVWHSIQTLDRCRGRIFQMASKHLIWSTLRLFCFSCSCSAMQSAKYPSSKGWRQQLAFEVFTCSFLEILQ